APPLAPLPDWFSDGRLRSDAVVDALLDLRAATEMDALLLAVTGGPLGDPAGAGVFGEAAGGGGCAVAGLALLQRASSCDETGAMERAEKLALHETAHAIGLAHCADPTCVMYPARDIADLDRKARGFCARCSDDLEHATLDATRG